MFLGYFRGDRTIMSDYAVGTLVKARGREWVVLPGSDDETLLVRPLSGNEEESTGIYLPLENVEHARFDLPNPEKLGDYRSCRILRDAIRIGFRSSAGPFRSFAQIAVEPRPYQIVPLLMALKLDPVRLLIADDVGIGKTIEALMIARELLDRGEIRRMTVLCPPHLAEQWQKELLDKFHIEAELVLSGTVKRLESRCGINQSLFEIYPFTVVSTDFIKSDKHRQDFLRACPELVIVDEAHTCSWGGEGRGGRHQRFELIKRLAQDTKRHIIFVTATPHSGNKEAFHSLLKFLNDEFSDLPEDLSGTQNESYRRQLALYLVQRTRADIRYFMQKDTPFPERLEKEENYKLSPEYKNFFQRILNYARERVRVPGESRHRQRVRWWSALALLRSLASSPAAAASTLRNRAAASDTQTEEEADDVGRRTVMDIEAEDTIVFGDITPGAECEEQIENEETKRERNRLLDMAREAEKLMGTLDNKLQKAIILIKNLLKEDAHPIVFCRFIHTAEYVAEYLRKYLPRDVEVIAVTGLLPPEEREERVSQLALSEKRVLVCTDCLSEGVNLQEHFDAVMHYDLSWNPTRHEQREGRVDRFGQPRSHVRTVMYYGIDNQIDGIVLDILLKKHKRIRNDLGISVPVPVDTNQVVEAILEGILLREGVGYNIDHQIDLFGDFYTSKKEELHNVWDEASKREKRSRTVFAQETIKPDEVAKELKAVQEAMGLGTDVGVFVKEALKMYNGHILEDSKKIEFDLKETSRSLRDSLFQSSFRDKTTFKARFDLPVEDDIIYLHRTHPIVENLASYVMNAALDESCPDPIARRAGVMHTRLVDRRTTLLLVRFRYHILKIFQDLSIPLLAEDCQILAFEGASNNAIWLDSDAAMTLLEAKPHGNIIPEKIRHYITTVIDNYSFLLPHIEVEAKKRGEELLKAHQRVREAARMKNVRYKIEPKLPPDILGIYIYLPVPEAM